MNKQQIQTDFHAWLERQGYRTLDVPEAGKGYTSSHVAALWACWFEATAYCMADNKAPTYFTADHAQSMLLRDYFAAKAMQGFLASGRSTADFIREYLPTDAFCLADAMLKARSA
jgi:hypothetical protein